MPTAKTLTRTGHLWGFQQAWHEPLGLHQSDICWLQWPQTICSQTLVPSVFEFQGWSKVLGIELSEVCGRNVISVHHIRPLKGGGSGNWWGVHPFWEVTWVTCDDLLVNLECGSTPYVKDELYAVMENPGVKWMLLYARNQQSTW